MTAKGTGAGRSVARISERKWGDVMSGFTILILGLVLLVLAVAVSEAMPELRLIADHLEMASRRS